MTLLVSMLPTVLQAQQAFDFVPAPAQVQYPDGGASHFVFDKNVRIVGGDDFNVRYLREHLARVFNPLGDSWAGDPTRSIEFVRVKSFPEEGLTIPSLEARS